MLSKTDILHLRIAKMVAQESYCTRRKVGAVLLTQDLIPIIGYNGTASGLDNVCELEDGTTNPEVLHAEDNAFAKAMKAGLSTMGSTLYVTLQPCLNCAKMAYQAGVWRVVYIDPYRCNKGVDFLEKCGLIVEQADI